MDRITVELELLRRFYPEAEYVGTGRWVRLPHFSVPAEPGWSPLDVAVAVQFPPAYPGQKPYGFFVSPPLSLVSGAAIQNVVLSDEPPWAGPWMKFSWDAPEWAPTGDVHSGSNMLNFILTIIDRLNQGA